jgi:tRNA nucleotidyltransferase (CCA-adding enzyme)
MQAGSMQRYLVGGAVRDRLLGLPVQDRDYVVVGATPESMLAHGYTPVGKDFPVFLHPQTHEEHALARTERKTAPGYRGFVFHADADVTLEEDLIRRDLTINAMAQADDGSIIDPFGGRADLQARLLRHVSPAFSEDPVRILRVARFAARFTEFSVAPETLQYMRAMVTQGEVDALVPERVWQEFSRGLMEARPSRMIDVLRACGALARLLPAVAGLWPDAAPAAGQTVLAQLDAAADAGASLPVRTAVLLQAIACARSPDQAQAQDGLDTTAIAAACARLKIPVDCRDLAMATGRERDLLQAMPSTAAQAVAVLERCDAVRKPDRFDAMLDTIRFLDTDQAILDRWRQASAAARAVDAGAIAQQVRQTWPQEPMRINQAVRDARIAAVAAIVQAPQESTPP